MRVVFVVLGLVALGLAILGAVLPLLPTTPFVLLAAYCFARSSKRLHAWLLSHPYFGPIIRNWQASGAIAPRHKFAAGLGMASTLGISYVLGVSMTVIAVQAVVLLMVATFVMSRPHPNTVAEV